MVGLFGTFAFPFSLCWAPVQMDCIVFLIVTGLENVL